MTKRWEYLPWDSEFFGIEIGRVDLDGASAASIAEAEADAAGRGVACLYGSLDPIDARAAYDAQVLGYRFVEAATTFSLGLSEPPIPQPEGVTVRLGTTEDLPAVAEMVDGLAPWSRYAADPRFGPDAALRMQRAWAARAAADGQNRALVLATDATGVIAFITRVRDPEPRVDGVGTTARGSGAARFLIEEARAWAGDQVLLGGPIAGRNVAALRYVSHCNYRVAKVRYLYHRWLDEEPVTHQ